MGKLSSYPLKDPLVLADEIGAILDSEEALDADKNKRAALSVVRDVLLSLVQVVDFDPQDPVPSHKRGRMYYDSVKNNHVLLNDVTDVAMDLGLEVWVRVRNDTGVTITNGKIVHISGVASGLPQITLAKADSITTTSVLGFATHDIEDNTIGYVVTFGEVNDVDTTGFSDNDTLFLSETSAGDSQTSIPAPPNFIVNVGRVMIGGSATGKILVRIGAVQQPKDVPNALSFTSFSGSTTQTNFLEGNYVFGTSNFTPSGSPVTLGTVNIAYGMHPFVVLGASSTDMIVRFSGSIYDPTTGLSAAGTSDVDTSGGVLDDYFESTVLFIGQVSTTLLSGTGVTVVQGFASAWDNNDQRFIMTHIKWTGRAGFNDSDPNFIAIHHSSIGWTYTTGGAIPPAPFVDMSVSYSPDNDFLSGEYFNFTRSGFSEIINGEAQEGVVFGVDVSNNSSIAYSNMSMQFLQ